MQRFFALLFLPLIAMAALPAPNLPSKILDYRPARLPNGCMVEAVVFADFFMAGEFDGPKSWAQGVFITGRVAGKKFDHAVALFQFKGRIFLWDIEWGVLPLDLDQAQQRGSLTQIAESTYNAWLARAEKLAARGNPPTPLLATPRAPGVSELDAAAERLGRTRPTLRVNFQDVQGDQAALAFVVGERVFLYRPEIGTTASAVTRDLRATLEKLVRSQAGGISHLTLGDLRLPPALPDKVAAAASP